jgi:succinylglutamate desuccinylase
MKVIEKGKGESELVIVGSLHGDEPAGKKAIDKILDRHEEFRKPVKFIIPSEKALEENKRYLDVDPNSSFPGDKDSDKYEKRLAAEITEEVKGKTVLDIHTTRSTERPFATMKNTDEETIRMAEDVNVDNAVYFPEESGVLIEQAETGLIVETGPQGTENAEKDAYQVLENFLSCSGVIDGECNRSNPELYRYTETVEGDWEFTAENFQKVEKGQAFAKREGEKLTADEAFYPVLMSTDGYSGKLGYKAQKL